MKQNFYKTEHFRYRQWDRGVEDKIIDTIIGKVRSVKAKKQ